MDAKDALLLVSFDDKAGYLITEKGKFRDKLHRCNSKSLNDPGGIHHSSAK